MAKRSWITTQLMKFVASKPGAWLYLNVIPVIDRPLLRLTNGRISFSLGQPVLLLTATGAKSGLERTTPLVYTLVDEKLILIASAGGSPKHPAWYHNLRKNPQCTVTFAGKNRNARGARSGGR